MVKRGAHVRGETFEALCREYQTSTKFRSFGLATQNLWGRELQFACRVLGNTPFRDVRPDIVQGYLDGWADKPAKQKVALAAFRALEKWASVRYRLGYGHFVYGVEVEGSSGGHMPWSDEQVAIGEANARPDIARIITLGANTGQRRSDLVRMGWGDLETFQGLPGINVTQVKTGRKLWIPISDALSKAMATWEKRPGPFCLDLEGRPWNPHDLTNAWTYERSHNPKLAELRDLVLHGLRGHACVKLFRMGKNPKEIATLVGMSTPMVETYTKLSQQRLDAVAAVYNLGTYREQNVQKSRGSDSD